MFQTTNQIYIYYMLITGVNIHIFQLYVIYMPFISGYQLLQPLRYIYKWFDHVTALFQPISAFFLPNFGARSSGWRPHAPTAPQ